MGVCVYGTTIKPAADNGWHGLTEHESVFGLLPQWEDWRDGSTTKGSPYIAQAIIAMAGYAAQRLRRRKDHNAPRDPRKYGTSPDRRNAYRALVEYYRHIGKEGYTGPPHDRLLKTTKTLVRRHKSAIARMADALLRLDELDSQHVEAIVPVGRRSANHTEHKNATGTTARADHSFAAAGGNAACLLTVR